MRYSDEVIEEVRSRNDIVDVISGYVKLQRKGSSYFGLCPFHNEKTGSFSVTPSKQMFYCFGCQTGGNVITFLMKYENCSFAEALKILADRAGIALPEPDYSKESRERADRRRTLFDIQKDAASYFYAKLRSPSGEKAMTYLVGRGLSEEMMRTFGLGYSDKYNNDLYRVLKEKGYSDELLRDSGLFSFDEKKGFTDKFWNRVMFPIMDANSRVIGFGGRVMGDAKPKYLNSPETEIFDKSRNLYGLNAARRSRRKNMIICEGYMDVISMHQAGYTNAVASLGTALTSQQCSLLSRYTREVLLLYDMDEAGIRAALRAIPMLREAGIRTKVVDLTPSKDPDEFIKKEGADAFAARCKAAENSFLFEVRMLEADYNLQDPQEKSDFLHATADRIVELDDEIERDSYIEVIARQYGISRGELKKLVGNRAMAAIGKTPVRSYSSEEKKRPDRPAGRIRSQQLMLAWLASEPQIATRLRPVLSTEDFTAPLCRRVAEMLFAQIDAGHVSPAEIISHFEDEKEQTKVAALFHTELPLESDLEREKALQDVFYKLKESSLRERTRAIAPGDVQAVQELANERKKLEALKKTGLPVKLRTE